MTASSTIRFDLACQEWPEGRGTFKVEVTGSVYLIARDRDGRIEHNRIGAVKFMQSKMLSNPVAGYVERLRAMSLKALDTQGKNTHRLFECENETDTTYFEGEGYNMLVVPYESTAPTDTLEYSTASNDLNPIHRSRYMAELAGLPRCIVHGMWTFATSRRVVEVNLCGGDQRNLRHFSASFQAMVMPGERLWTQLKHVGFRRGRKIVEVTTSNVKGVTVLTGRAEIEPGTSAYVFTGQGSAAKGMGMDLYESSPAARELWDNADAHLQKTYGWSILDIVRRNPKSMTIHFGGKRGQAVRENFLALVCKDPETGEIVPLIPEISEASDSYSFHSPDGLLFATQFTQPALVLLEQSYFVDMVSRDMMSSHYMFAGHSLGEYAALAAAADVIPPLALLDLVFLRGLTMQRAVSRDASGRSDFGMVAASPMRVGPGFSEEDLHRVVDAVDQAAGKLVQVVNYNIEQAQYAVAGHLVGLHALGSVLDTIYKIGPAALLAQGPEAMAKIVAGAVTTANSLEAAATKVGGKMKLTRGRSTIPLNGIDVPFHSRFLRGGVPVFRETLHIKIPMEMARRGIREKLIGRYIPNVVAAVFSLTKAYTQLVFDATQSPVLQGFLEDDTAWSPSGVATKPTEIGYNLLVECLAMLELN